MLDLFKEAACSTFRWAKGVTEYTVGGLVVGGLVAAGAAGASAALPAGILVGAFSGGWCGIGRMFGEKSGERAVERLLGAGLGVGVGMLFSSVPLAMAGAVVGAFVGVNLSDRRDFDDTGLRVSLTWPVLPVLPVGMDRYGATDYRGMKLSRLSPITRARARGIIEEAYLRDLELRCILGRDLYGNSGYDYATALHALPNPSRSLSLPRAAWPSSRRLTYD